jgi:hypothetical protein
MTSGRASERTASQPPPSQPPLPLSWRQVLTRPDVRRPGLFAGGYMAISAAAASVGGNREFVFYIVVMCVLAAAVLAVHRRVLLSSGVLWCLSLWGLMHMAGGLVPVPEGWPIKGDKRVLYSLWLVPEYLKYDHITHAFGFGVTTWLCWQGLRRILAVTAGMPIGAVQPTLGSLVLCAAAGMGFGALNEVVEFTAVLLMPSTNVGGYVNTGWDLVSNLAGCVVAAIAIGSHRTISCG